MKFINYYIFLALWGTFSNSCVSNTQTLDQVQDQLIPEIVDDLIDQIYNATLGNW